MDTLIKYRYIHQILTYGIAMVWLVNGLFCKVLDGVPRHKQIVTEILGATYAGPLTVCIGLSELVMTAWILNGFKARLCAITQIMIVMSMNVIEFVLTPDLLLWGRWNILFASLFALLVYINAYELDPKAAQETKYVGLS